MALHKKGKRPPNPDPGNCLWIVTKEGGFWRRKRGTVKKAKLNTALKEGSHFMQLSAPAASRIIQKLRPYMNGLYTGRLNTKISGRLRMGLKETGKLNLRCLKGFDLQQDQQFEQLLQAKPQIQQTAHELTVSIPIAAHTVKRINTLVTNYYFELVLLYGDVSKENGLRTESIESDVYEIEKDYNMVCRLSMVLPEKEWIALLKVNSIEGNELARSHKLYGMKVVKTHAPILAPIP
jgi:hypothetical protein